MAAQGEPLVLEALQVWSSGTEGMLTTHGISSGAVSYLEKRVFSIGEGTSQPGPPKWSILGGILARAPRARALEESLTSYWLLEDSQCPRISLWPWGLKEISLV